MAVEGVMDDIGHAADEPFVERGVAVIKHLSHFLNQSSSSARLCPKIPGGWPVNPGIAERTP
jgi:hypothetical protein